MRPRRWFGRSLMTYRAAAGSPYICDMLRYWLLVCICLVAVKGLAQEKATLPTPAGWGSEEFSLPPAFAPEIKYKGKEELRFAPGWADSASANYWTYAFLWDIEGVILVHKDTLRRQLIGYYNGLYLTNKKMPPAGYSRHFTQVRVTKEINWGKDRQSFTAKAYTYNFLTGKQIDLLLRVHVRPNKSGTRTSLLFEVSPKPYGDAVWKGLDALVGDFRSE